MTIKNNRPTVLTVTQLEAGFQNVIVKYSTARLADPDLSGLAIWHKTSAQSKSQATFTLQQDFDRGDFQLGGLSTGTVYNITAGFVDEFAQADSAVLQSQYLNEATLVNLTDSTILTKIPSIISGHEVLTNSKDIGDPTTDISFNFSGNADEIEIQARPIGGSYSTVYKGPRYNGVSISRNPGTWQFRVRSIHTFSVGSVETTSYTTYGQNVVVAESQTPSQPGTLSFSAAKINDSATTYTLRASWPFNNTGGPNRNFVIQVLPNPDKVTNLASLNWSNARTEVTTSPSFDFFSFPYRKHYAIRVQSAGWGTQSSSYRYGSVYITSNTSESSELGYLVPQEVPFSTNTKVQINDSFIRGYSEYVEGNPAQQTISFSFDASTGNVVIGKAGVSYDGYTVTAPFIFDAQTERLQISGHTITDKITAAEYVLGWLGGNSPSIRTANKEGYGDPNPGLWAGYTDSGNSNFKIDIGSSTQFIRWDGQNLNISGGVSIAGVSAQDLAAGSLERSGLFRFYTTENVSGRPSSVIQDWYETLYAAGTQREGDVLIAVNTNTELSVAYTYTSGAWTQATAFIGGDMVVDGGISARNLRADFLSTRQFIAESPSGNKQVKIGFDPGDPGASPIEILKDGDSIFSFLETSAGDSVLNLDGSLGKDTIRNMSSFSAEVLKQILPVGGTGGTQTSSNVNLNTGSQTVHTVTLENANSEPALISCRIRDSESYISGAGPRPGGDFTAPQWTVKVYRGVNTSGTLVFDQTFTGTAYNNVETEGPPLWENNFNINVEASFTDANHNTTSESSLSYTFEINRVSGSHNNPTLRDISISVPLTGAGARALDQLNDVDLTSPAAHQVLQFDSSSNSWVNKNLSDLAGTGLTTTSSGELRVQFGTTSTTSVAGNDTRLSNSREWTADTVSQAEAQTGTSTTRRAWTSQRVRQNVMNYAAPISHTHPISEILGLNSALDNKASVNHSHTSAQLPSNIVYTDNTQTITAEKTFSAKLKANAGVVIGGYTLEYNDDTESLDFNFE